MKCPFGYYIFVSYRSLSSFMLIARLIFEQTFLAIFQAYLAACLHLHLTPYLVHMDFRVRPLDLSFLTLIRIIFQD